MCGLTAPEPRWSRPLHNIGTRRIHIAGIVLSIRSVRRCRSRWMRNICTCRIIGPRGARHMIRRGDRRIFSRVTNSVRCTCQIWRWTRRCRDILHHGLRCKDVCGMYARRIRARRWHNLDILGGDDCPTGRQSVPVWKSDRTACCESRQWSDVWGRSWTWHCWRCLGCGGLYSNWRRSLGRHWRCRGH